MCTEKWKSSPTKNESANAASELEITKLNAT